MLGVKLWFFYFVCVCSWVASGWTRAWRHRAGHPPSPQRASGGPGTSQHWQTEMSGATRWLTALFTQHTDVMETLMCQCLVLDLDFLGGFSTQRNVFTAIECIHHQLSLDIHRKCVSLTLILEVRVTPHLLRRFELFVTVVVHHMILLRWRWWACGCLCPSAALLEEERRSNSQQTEESTKQIQYLQS